MTLFLQPVSNNLSLDKFNLMLGNSNINTDTNGDTNNNNQTDDRNIFRWVATIQILFNLALRSHTPPHTKQTWKTPSNVHIGTFTLLTQLYNGEGHPERWLVGRWCDLQPGEVYFEWNRRFVVSQRTLQCR